MKIGAPSAPGPRGHHRGAFYNKTKGVGTSEEYVPGFAAFASFNRPDDLEYFSIGTSELTESAFYGEVGYDITKKLNVIVGARRYQYDLKTFSDVSFPLFDPGFVIPAFQSLDEIPFDPTAGQKDDGWLFKFNASYKFSDDILAFLTVSEGYRIGNSNGLPTCPPFTPGSPQTGCALAPGQRFGPNPGDLAAFDERAYTPDKTLNYELGVKSTLLGGKLILNGSVYFIDWKDPQVSSATVAGSIPITINASGAQSYGAELSGDLQVTDAWRVRANYAYNSNELTQVVPSLIRTITPPGFGTAFIDGKAGDRLPGSPENKFSIFSSYEWRLANGAAVTFDAQYAYQSEVLTRAGGRGSSLTLDAYGVADASVTYKSDGYSVTAYASNLFDEYIETGARATPLFNQTVSGANVRSFYTNVAPPRAIGVRFQYDF